MDNDLQKAIQAIKSGNKQLAFKLLKSAIEADPRGIQAEKAWLWMSAILDDPERKRQCLETVLDINPDNATAKEGLRKLSAPSQILHELPSVDDIMVSSPLSSPNAVANNKISEKPRTGVTLAKIGVVFLFLIAIACVGLPLFAAFISAVSLLEETGTPRNTQEDGPASPPRSPTPSLPRNMSTLLDLMDELDTMSEDRYSANLRQAVGTVQDVYAVTSRMDQQLQGHPGYHYFDTGLRYYERSAEYYLDYITKGDDVYLRLAKQYDRDGNAELGKGFNTPR